MKRLSLTLVLALVLCTLFATLTMAAPTVSVAAKYQYLHYDHYTGIEANVGVAPNLSVIFTGMYDVSDLDFLFLGIGGRYYFLDGAIRPFASAYVGALLDVETSPVNVGPYVMGTAGLEYHHECGFLAGAEIGGVYAGDSFCCPGWHFTVGGFVGYAF